MAVIHQGSPPTSSFGGLKIFMKPAPMSSSMPARTFTTARREAAERLGAQVALGRPVERRDSMAVSEGPEVIWQGWL